MELINCLIKCIITMAAKTSSCFEYRFYGLTEFIHSKTETIQPKTTSKMQSSQRWPAEFRNGCLLSGTPDIEETNQLPCSLPNAAGLIGIMPEDVTRASTGTSVELSGMMPSSRICTEYESATSK